jgi:hypothetical protein
MLLGMVVQTAAKHDETTQTIIRACTANYSSGEELAFVPDDDKASLCTTANRVLEEASIQMHQPKTGNDDGFSVNHLLAAGRQIADHLASQKPSCTNNAMEFAYSQSSAIGLFARVEIYQHGVTSDVLKKLLEHAQNKGVSETTVVQLCRVYSRGTDYSIGIVAASTKNLACPRGGQDLGRRRMCFSSRHGRGLDECHFVRPRLCRGHLKQRHRD